MESPRGELGQTRPLMSQRIQDDQKGPQRIGGSRVKSACLTCKKRHLKCDEARPECRKCLKAGYPCTYSAGAPVDHQKALRVIQYTPPLLINPGHLNSLTKDEVRGTEFYHLQTADELSGFFNSQLWSQTIPQIANTEPAVRFALFAVSAMHENFRLGREIDTELAMQHYSKAIQHVVKFDNSQSNNLETVLASCLLFVLIEIFQGHYAAALTHVSSGVKLLSSATQSGYENDWPSHFRGPFLYFDTQAIEIGDQSYRPFLTPHIEGKLPPLPEKFATVEEAHYIFNALYNRFTRIWQWIDAPLELMSTSTRPDSAALMENYQLLQQYTVRWNEAFSRSEFCKSEPAVTVLQINKTVMNILLDTVHFGMKETSWDDATSQFRTAVELAEKLFNGLGRGSRTISTSIGIVPSLYLIAARCRHAQTRRRALHLLQTLNRKEGMWDSNAVAKIAEHVIHLEDAGALSASDDTTSTADSTQIPESARIKELEVKFEDGLSTSVRYKTSQGVVDDI